MLRPLLHHLLLPILLFLLPHLPPINAYICFPPPHLLPTHVDCIALLLGLTHLSSLPPDTGPKRWGRQLSTGPRTEQLPRWYYMVDETSPPATCGIMVDAGGGGEEVDTFTLADVVDASTVVYGKCLVDRGQLGLEFPGQGHIFARLVRLEGLPPVGAEGVGREGGRGLVRAGGEVRRLGPVQPGGKGVIYTSLSEPGGRGNGTALS